MCKIGDTVNVCFDGILEAEEMYNGNPFKRVCRVSYRMEDGRSCTAFVPKEFVGSTLRKDK